jgi:hypothetical protein
VQLNDLVRAAADMLGYTLRSHGIELELQLADPLPEVQADADQIGQVVLNLIVNAQQALAGTAGPRRVVVQTGPSTPASVNRCGCAWPTTAPACRQVREQIFEPFFTTKAEGMGTGLGLAVSRSLAREHGGDLVLEDGAEGGSFRLSLPSATSRRRRRRWRGRRPPPRTTAATAGRVLVVDDEAEIADWCAACSRPPATRWPPPSRARWRWNCWARRASTPSSDLRMPDMDGAALWREVRERNPRWHAHALRHRRHLEPQRAQLPRPGRLRQSGQAIQSGRAAGAGAGAGGPSAE